MISLSDAGSAWSVVRGSKRRGSSSSSRRPFEASIALRWAATSSRALWVKPAIGGALIGVIAIGFPEIFGVGYEAINEALTGDLGWKLLLLLVLVKIVAVSLTIGSGGSGGIFAPSLFIGAMAGGAAGTVVHSLWPTATGSAGAYALVGMAAVVAAATHAPITAIVMIFELTSDYKIILPLMISSIIATLLATRMQKASIYTLKLLRRGVDIRGGLTANMLGDITARDTMRVDFAEVGRGDSLMSVISRFVDRQDDSVVVTAADQRLLGVITIDDIRPVMQDPESVRELIIAEDIMRTSGFPVFSPDDSLDEVMGRFGQYRFIAPVVENDRVVGALWPLDVIESYNTEMLKRDMASTMAATVGHGPVARALPGVPGMSMAEIPAPERLFRPQPGVARHPKQVRCQPPAHQTQVRGWRTDRRRGAERGPCLPGR